MNQHSPKRVGQRLRNLEEKRVRVRGPNELTVENLLLTLNFGSDALCQKLLGVVIYCLVCSRHLALAQHPVEYHKTGQIPEVSFFVSHMP